jgi:glycosyltransferase involved in cell wall biosynthesis
MKKKIKILHVTKGFYPEIVGGIETFIFTLCSELKKKYNFSIFCLGNTTSTYKYKNIKIYKFKKTFQINSCPISLDALLKFKKIALNYDIIHYHYPYPFMDILDLLISKIKITTYHSDIVKQKILGFFYIPLKNIFLNRQSLVIFSSFQYLRTSKILESIKNKAKIINFGIKFKQVKSDQILKKKKYILFIGSLRYYKGLDILLKAAKNIKSEIIICGKGKELNKLINLKNQLRLKNVRFTGHVIESLKMKLLKNCELFVFPSNSRSEAFGISILEAMSFGKPIISCEIGTATSFLNIHNRTGFVIKPNDSLLLSKKINFLLDPKNIKIKKYFSKEALLRFKKKFSSKLMADKYYVAYKEVLKNHKI